MRTLRQYVITTNLSPSKVHNRNSEDDVTEHAIKAQS